MTELKTSEDFCLSVAIDKLRRNMEQTGFKREEIEFVILEVLKMNKEFVRRFKAHFTPVDKKWMDVEMFSAREIVDFINKLAGEKLTK